MLTIQGRKQQFCDGVTRRDALHIGAVAMGSVGFGLSDLLRAEGEAAARANGKNLINIFLHGGPTHMDTFDLKPEAPKEYPATAILLPSSADASSPSIAASLRTAKRAGSSR